MTIKLALATVAEPSWTLAQAAQQAAALGYAGLELRTLGNEAAHLAGDPARLQPTEVKNTLRAAGVPAVCLATSIALHPRKAEAGQQALAQGEKALQLAADIDCPMVRFFGHEIEPWQLRRVAMQRIADRVLTLAEQAERLGVTILLENAGGLSTARDWWWLLTLADHPKVGLLWNVANAAQAGENPVTSVSMLHHRIRMGKIKDLHLSNPGTLLPLGTGDVPVATFIHRLMGIGFDGFVSVEWDRLWLPALGPAEAHLSDARQKVQAWIDAARPKPPAKAKPHAPAAAPPAPAAATSA